MAEMEVKEAPAQGQAPEAAEGQEPMVKGIPHRLLDGFDELNVLPPEKVQELMADAPDYIKARAAEWQKQRGGQGNPDA